MNKNNKLIGFIGQGWIGKSYADNFELRGYKVVRYGLEDPYINNGKKIKDCDIVFIAVPTPTTPEGFNDDVLRKVIKKVGRGKIAVIKSTVLPGTTQLIQEDNPEIYVMHSPEFLTTHKAVFDAANPDRNIIGIPVVNGEYKKRAEEVMAVLPDSPYQIICPVKNAEIAKYGGNCFFYFKNIFFNLLYDLVSKYDCDWNTVREIIAADPRIGEEHTNPIHKGGRGAGGGCLIKDFAAFSKIYKELVNDNLGDDVLMSLKEKNIDLLLSSGKDLDLLEGVYGKDIVKK